MSQLTSTAKQVYIRLAIGNLLVIFSIILLGQYFYYMTAKPIIRPSTVHAVVKLVRTIKEQPQTTWPTILSQKSIRWSKITLSETPQYQNNALFNLRAMNIVDSLKQHQKLEMSVFLKEGAWLNITMLPPVPNQWGIWITGLGLLFILLGVSLLINYWAVNQLNQPIQTLIQSLKYSEGQEQWLPIPLTGNLDQKVIFEKINLLQEKVSQLLQNRTRVVTAISHDLRTPLTRLKLRTEYLADTPHYEKMMHDINDMEMMIRDTLDYFRDVNQEEVMQRFDLISLLHSLAEDSADLQHEVHFETAIDKLVFKGYVNLLKRALSNLINNAVIYGQRAFIHCEIVNDHIEILIQDNGPGLEKADLDRVFIPFYRGEHSRSRETGGTGLGLTIAKEIIEKHGGRITLSNRIAPRDRTVPESEGLNKAAGLEVLIVLPISFE